MRVKILEKVASMEAFKVCYVDTILLEVWFLHLFFCEWMLVFMCGFVSVHHVFGQCKVLCEFLYCSWRVLYNMELFLCKG